MKNIKRISKKVLCLMLAIVLVCSCNITAFASANSGASNHDDPTAKNYRAYLEYLIPTYNSNGTIAKGASAGVIRQNVMHTYVKAGETVYFGSSICDSVINLDGMTRSTSQTGCDIVVTYPDGTPHPFDVIENGAGYIDRRVETQNGPRIGVGDTNPDKYEPLSFTAEVSGLYDFSFRSRYGNIAVPTSVRVKDSDAAAMKGQHGGSTTQGADIAFWDITVADQDGNEISGRTYSKFLALSTGNSKYLMDALYYIVTNDGYIYKSEFKDIQPNGFVFFSNNQGLTTTGLTSSSIYHSIYDDDNNCDNTPNEEYVTFQHPNAPDTDLDQTNMIFYEEPNQDLVGILFDKPTIPKDISEISFSGYRENKTYFTQGGKFEFESHGASSVSLVIDFNVSINDVLADPNTSARVIAAINSYRQAGGSGIVEINGAAVDGMNSFVWNGMDNKDVHMPVGIYNTDEIAISATPKAGEIHFPFIDVEGCYKGIIIERLNGVGGRDSNNPSDDRFNIYYNNNPLVYNTIEGKADTSITPVKDSNNTKYYLLSDGTRSYDVGKTNGALGGPAYFVNGYNNNTTGLTYTIGDKNISTLIANTNYVAPENEDQSDLATNVEPKYIHQPVDSRYTSVIYAQSSVNENNGGGNQAIVDVWAYTASATKHTAKMKAEIEIVDNEGVGDISGRVFYDFYNNGKYNKTYNPADGDYPLQDISVSLVDASGKPIQVTSERGFTVFVDTTNGNFIYKDSRGNYLDYNEDPVVVNEEKLEPVYYTTTTDAKGYYSFMGVYYGKGQSKDFYVKVNLTDVQRSSYDLCTTSNDNCLSTEKQKVTLNDDNPAKQFGDIGYTAKNVPQTDLTVLKYWDDSIKNPEERVYIKLYQVTSDGSEERLYDEKSLSATNGWKYTFTNLNKTYKYYVKEYVDDGMGDYDLVGTSEARFIDKDNYDSEITNSTTAVNNDSGYFANFTFNPNIVGPTIVITNKEIIHNYRVVFHKNFNGYADINTEDYYKIYCRENAIPTVKKNTGFDNVYALNDDTWDIDAFYDIPQRDGYVFAGWYYEPHFSAGTKPLKWTTDIYSGDNTTDNDGDKYTMTANNVYHIYAHWIPVGTVEKDGDDEKIYSKDRSSKDQGYYGGFDLIGVQIRDYRLDPNYDNGDTFYGYKKEIHGLRFIASIRNGLLKAVNDVYDVDAKQEFYDYENTKTYSKNAAYQNIDYGFVTGSRLNWDKFYGNYDGKNGYVYDQIKYNGTNVNGEKTSSKYKYVKNIECTSSVGPNYVDKNNIDKDNAYHPTTSILDHRNYKDYRIMSMILPFNDETDLVNHKDDKIISRPYLKYVDSNGLVRVHYSDYNGTQEATVGKGCCTSYTETLTEIQDELERVILFNKNN